MDPRFQPHNSHLHDPLRFQELDPHLRALSDRPLVHESALLDDLPVGRAGIFTVTGGRQVGKTTMLKQWMRRLLETATPPGDIAYYTGELIDDHHALVRILTRQLGEPAGKQTRYILLDEVTYINGWDRGVKFLADAGILEDTALVLTGSDAAILKESRVRLPGRRGRESTVDFHLHPLSFAEAVRLEHGEVVDRLAAPAAGEGEPSPSDLGLLFDAFDRYLVHGGFLTALNDMAAEDRILPATLAVYSDWIRGDVLKRGKQERYLREVLAAVVRRTGSQVTWNNLAQDLSIDHPQTVADYVQLLEAMDVLFIQPALVEDKLAPAPKKARKVMFTDPFIFHAVRSWLNPVGDPYGDQVSTAVSDPSIASRLAEACAVAHVRRRHPTYYIKAKGEVDIAYVHRGAFHPVEIKWTRQIRPADLKQVVKYPHARIWNRSRQPGTIGGVPTEPLPLALLRIP